MRTVIETRCRGWLGVALALCVTVPAALAQQPTNSVYPVFELTNTPAPTAESATPASTPAPPPSAPPLRSAAELEKLALPIALHPDPLIAIILPAAVYPVEIVQAAQFVQDTNNLSLLDQQPWDANVKAVARFPDLIAKMNADLAWTVGLGKAFLDQPKDLMDTIQALRAKAQKAGTLRTTEQQIVNVTNTVVEKSVEQQVMYVTNTLVEIQPANPEVVYVPSYPETVYYPPPAYVYDPYAPLVTFGAGLAVGAIIANNCDWHGGGVYVGPHGAVVWGGSYHGNVEVNRNVNVNRGVRPTTHVVNPTSTTVGVNPTATRWQPDQSRLRNSGAAGSAQSREARGWGGGATQVAQRPATGSGAARPSQLGSSSAGGARPAQPARTQSAGQKAAVAQRPVAPAAGPRPATTAQRPAATRPQSPAAAARPAPSPTVNRPPPPRPTAYSGVNSGGNARYYSNRGAASRGGGMRGGGRRR